ncbi:MAG: EamA family transporter RarD [Chloroflexi bacterium]|nr:EamA family transporter RarD [Chloroflexota bacterium]
MTDKRGVFSVAAAYLLWGFLPIFWKSVQMVSASELLAHRIAWSFVFVVLLLIRKKEWAWLQQARRNPRILITFLVTASILAFNWFTFVWAINAGHIVDASLGYFINPLFSVLLGMIFLKERLRPWQWVAIGIATGGVIFLTLGYGTFPWIAFALAISFGFYGLLRKIAPLEALEGLSVETAVLFLPALVYLVYAELVGTAFFGHAGTTTNILLAFTGVVTALPLIWFAYGARRVTLATVGILQYIAPTFQFLLGVLVYGEEFTEIRVIGFSVIWAALIIYSIEGAIEGRKQTVRQSV